MCSGIQSLSHFRLFVAAWTVCSLPGSSVHGISQARILEWVVISFSRGSSQPRDGTQVSCVSCIVRQILYCCTTWEAIENLDMRLLSTALYCVFLLAFYVFLFSIKGYIDFTVFGKQLLTVA